MSATLVRRAAFVASVLAAIVSSGCCCLTNSMWNQARELPVGLTEARMLGDDLLLAVVHFTDGEAYEVTIDTSGPSERWGDLDATWVRTDPLDANTNQDLVESIVLEDAGLRVRVHTGSIDFRQVVSAISVSRHPGWDSVGRVRCDTPIGWAGGRAASYALLTPFTFLVDVLATPVQIAWVFGTVGGHGSSWVPWCNPERSERVLSGME